MGPENVEIKIAGVIRMQIKMKGLLWGVSLVAAVLLTGFYCYQVYMDYWVPVPYIDRVMAVPVVENMDFLEGRQQQASEQNPGVYFGGVLLP